MAAVLTCEQCGAKLALADESCHACGRPVPAETRRKVLVGRAEALAQDEAYADAARALEPVLRQEMPAEEARLLWRKRGGWLIRSGRPELLDAAESAMAESLRLDDSDDLSHQLWIDILSRRGLLDKAKAWYAQRLQLNPDDVMAQRQQQIIRLSADFKAAPLPTLSIPESREGLFIRAFKPNAGKMITAALVLLFTLYQLYTTATGGGVMGALKNDPLMGSDQMGGIVNALMDPWLAGFQAVAAAAYLFWGWRIRRRRG